MRLSYLAILLLPLGLSGCLSFSSTEPAKSTTVYTTPPAGTSTTTTIVCTAGAPPPCY